MQFLNHNKTRWLRGVLATSNWSEGEFTVHAVVERNEPRRIRAPQS